MKVFVGNPPMSNIKVPKLRWSFIEPIKSKYYPFPFYLAYTSSLLKKNGHDVLFIDGMADGMKVSEFIERIKKFNPDYILFETSKQSFSNDVETLKKVKKENNKTVMSGFFLTYNPNVVLNYADYVLIGEYEKSMLNLVEQRPLTKDLVDVNTLPFPDRESLNINNYYEGSCLYPKPMAWLWASRGCPYSCVFCTVRKFYKSRARRQRSVENVISEIDELIKSGKYKFYYFDDDIFNFDREWVYEFCEAVRDRKIKWGAMCRADLVSDNESLKKMKISGCYGLRFGVESGSQLIMNKIKKNLNLDKVRETIRNCKKLGIKTHLTFIFGFLWESKNTIEETKKFLIETNPTTAQLCLLHHYEGTEIKAKDIKTKIGKEGIDYCMKEWRKYKITHTPFVYLEGLWRHLS